MKLLKKTVLVIVPHPDDELSIAGGLVSRLVKNGYVVKVVIVTNGDAEILGEIRIKESIKGLSILGVKRQNIIFLGYGNRWEGNTHIYNKDDKEILCSLAKYKTTYSIATHREYHYKKYKEPAMYKRENLFDDMKCCIEDVHAEIIICVDFDSHPDHRATSLLFEECMGEIIMCTDYRPIILKRFAYAFAWHDSYSKSLKKISRYRVFDSRYQLDNPYYNWRDRIVYKLVDDKLSDLRMCFATLAYPSQNAKSHIRQLLKKEMVFWNRRTDNLIFDATINVSSGDKKYLYDFKRFDCKNVNLRERVNFWKAEAWIPDEDDCYKTVYIEWIKSVYVSYLVVYPALSEFSEILDCVIKLDEKVYHTGYLQPDNPKKIYIEKSICKMAIRIDKFIGEKPGISEIEIYSNGEQDFLDCFSQSVAKLS